MLGDRREAFYDALLEEIGSEYTADETQSVRVALDIVFSCDILQQLVSIQFAQYGLSRSTFNILMLLHHSPEHGMQLHELGELLLVSRANVTGLIDHLEEKHLVTRTADANDRRVRFARITQAGQGLLQDLIPVHYRTVQLLLNGLSSEEKGSLTKLLKKMRASVNASHARCGIELPARMKSES